MNDYLNKDHKHYQQEELLLPVREQLEEVPVFFCICLVLFLVLWNFFIFLTRKKAPTTIKANPKTPPTISPINPESSSDVADTSTFTSTFKSFLLLLLLSTLILLITEGVDVLSTT